MIHNVTYRTFGHVRLAKIQISQHILHRACVVHVIDKDANAQADLSLRLTHISKGTFSHVVDY